MYPEFTDFMLGVLIGALAVAVADVFLYIGGKSKKKRRK